MSDRTSFVISKQVQDEYWKVERTIKRNKERKCGICLEPLLDEDFICKYDLESRGI